MTEEQLKYIASQLRCPHGDNAIEVANKMNEGNSLINEAVLEALGPVSGTILEIGMANGHLVPEILNSGPDATYIGCDISHEMVSAATVSNADFVDAGRAQFHLVTPGQLPPGIVVETVFTVNTIYFWDDSNDFLTKIRSVLSPSGRLLIGFRPRHSMENYPFVQYGFQTYSEEDVSQMLHAAGFSVTDRVETREPDRDVLGEIMRVDHVVISAVKR